jgi:LmbE family N-acetylglucosaminyl deacetylase
MNILAIGAHPDDIEFGCAGTLIKYVQAGHKVNLLVLTDGSYGGDPAVRRKEQEDVATYIQAKELFWGGFRDTELVDNRQLISRIDEVVNIVKPDIVFLNYFEDVHQDHRAASEAGISSTRYIKEVLFYEVPTTQRFEPDIFVDIQDVLDKKAKALDLHASQLDKTRVKNLTIIESAQSCATFRGYQGRVKFAEGFKALRLLREIK